MIEYISQKIEEFKKLRETERIYALNEIIERADYNAPKAIKELRSILEKYGRGNIGLAQINTTIGDIKGNALKIVKYIRYAEAIGLDLVAFPELTLVGYPIEDIISRHHILVEQNILWLNEIAKITGHTKAIVGFVEENKSKTGKRYYNSVAVLANGKIESIIRKSLMPTYAEFYDSRNFESSPVVGCQPPETLNNLTDPIEYDPLSVVNGIKYGISICEDCWNNEEFFDKNLYDIDPVAELAKLFPDVLLNCSASPSRTKKEQLKHNMLGFIAGRHKTPLAYVNQVGGNDGISYEGASRVYNASGELIARAKSFEEQFLIVNPLKHLGKIYPLANGLEKTLRQPKEFSLDYEADLERTYKTIVMGIRDYFKKTGFKRAVLGLSGGLDSTVCAVLLADALGERNVFGVSMPSKLTSDESKSDAAELAKNLGINFAEAPIKPMFETINSSLQELFTKVEKKWDGRFKESYTPDNIQARSRAILLWGISNEFSSCLPIATSDKSELYMGYATINGDMSGGFAPIADVTKTKLFALARWMNKNRKKKNSIPENIILKRPGAELAIDPKTGKTLAAEDALMPYEFMDEVIWRIENKHESYTQMLESPFLYEIKAGISIKQKIEWLDKFYCRMSSGIYKWTIMPPSVMVDSHSINKNEYRQAITSGKIDYKGISEIEIRAMIG